jgi:diacylglycerol kinase family enzyme/membrane-associated phospholipid phosphatase
VSSAVGRRSIVPEVARPEAPAAGGRSLAPAPAPPGLRTTAGTGGLVAAAWALLVGVLVLGGQAVQASPGVTATDREVTAWLAAHRTAALDQAMRALTWAGTWVAALVLVAVLAILVANRRIGVLPLVAVVVGWAGQVAGVNLVKVVVQRPRPPAAVQLVVVHGWSFPSGHTATAVVVFSTVAALTCLLVRRTAVRVAACVLAAAVVGLVAFSRVELGAHWLSDVVASVVWTPCWLLASTSVITRSRAGHPRPAVAPEAGTARWWARAALGCVVVAIAVLLVFVGRRSLLLAVLTAVGAAVVAAACFWFLLNRGVLRWLALAVALLVPAGVIAVLAAGRLLWVVGLVGVLLATGVQAARTALRPPSSAWALPVVDAPPPRRAFLVMNPRSGGGKVARFGLADRARAMGAEVVLLEPTGSDVQQLARDAVDAGADLLGAAGGDGTQALVAQVAAERDVPFLVISAGTRNHFALDLGLDRDDPGRCLDALRDGVEARLDLGELDGRPFVNNASFGAYAEIVDDPAYRADKGRTALNTLPDLLQGRRGAHLTADVDGTLVDAPQALLVSNNPYEDGDLLGAGRRARLDGGVLGVISVRVDTARQAVGLLHHASARGLQRWVASTVTVSADADSIPVGIDGEAVRMPSPVHCSVRPGVLRVRLPRDRPGVRPPQARWDWAALWLLALGRAPAGSGRQDQREREADHHERPGEDALDVVGLGQHGGGEHGQQRPGGEGLDERAGEAVRGIEQLVPEPRGDGGDGNDPRPHEQHPALRPVRQPQPGGGGHPLGQVAEQHTGQQRDADAALQHGEAEDEGLGDTVEHGAEDDGQR